MFNFRFVLAGIALTLGACASSPEYVAADNAEDYGYYARKISEDRYRVNYNGSRRTSLQDSRDYALLRSAELTLNNGYDWFQIVDRETSTIETREPTVGYGYGYESARYVETNCGLLGCSRKSQPATYTSVHLDNRRAENRHSHSLEIRMGKGKIPEDGNYYDARTVSESILRSL